MARPRSLTVMETWLMLPSQRLMAEILRRSAGLPAKLAARPPGPEVRRCGFPAGVGARGGPTDTPGG